MKILFVNQFYAPDLAATGQRLRDLAVHLVQRGHDTHVICSRGVYDNGTGSPTSGGEESHGVRVKRLVGFAASKRSGWTRVLDYAAFHLLTGLRLLLVGWRYDAIITLTTPPLIGVYGAAVKALSFGLVRHVAWVMDLHPDAEFQLGMWSRRNPAWRFFYALNTWQMRAADAVVALGERMKLRIVAKGIDSNRVSVIPVWHDKSSMQVIPTERSECRHRNGWINKCVIMYCGNAGLAHTFDTVCRAMLALADDQRFIFVFVGGGKRIQEINDFVTREQLKNFVRLAYVPQEDLADTLAAADVHLVTLRDGMEGVAVPCKLYGIMASARPVVYIGPSDSDTAEHIRTSRAGRVLGSNDASGLIQTLKDLADSPSRREEMASRGREAFEARFERSVCCEAWHTLLNKVVGNP